MAILIHEPAPARALNTKCSSVKFFDQVVERAKVSVDKFGKWSWLEDTTDGARVLLVGRSQVGPEERVVDMA